ncbi:alpha/beta hydrolase [Streptomyces rubiginosohelvolus]|uniref:alpha/beta hydrolase n=1 Tax=Streptomyces rubiginosohelvolus TaxID=67362 RepID=UPI0036C4BFFE
MKRTEQIVPVPGGHCFVVLDEPDTAPTALVACGHGLTGDRCGPAELLSQWAGDSARFGVAVARMDFRGSGDSSGIWADTTFDGMVSDYLAVTAWAKSRYPDAPLVHAGLSTGGVIAAMAAARRPDVDGLLLMSTDFWEEPDPRPFVEVVREGEFHEPLMMPPERDALRARDVLAGLACPKRLIYGAQDKFLLSELPRLVACGVEAVPVPGVGHLFEGIAERRTLLAHTRSFLEELPHR